MDSKQATVRFSAFGALGDAEMLLLRDLAGPVRRLSRGDIIRGEGDATTRLYLLRSGWTASSIAVGGGGRQMIKVHVPGDMLGTPGLAMQRAPDTITALTDVALSIIELPALGRLFVETPRLAALLFLISQEERVMLMDRVATLGRADAMVRLVALVLDLHRRWLRNDPAAGLVLPLPLTQRAIADLAGLTPVHVSRVLGRLRGEGLLSWTGQEVTIHDLPALCDLVALPSRDLQADAAWIPPSAPPNRDRYPRSDGA